MTGQDRSCIFHFSNDQSMINHSLFMTGQDQSFPTFFGQSPFMTNLEVSSKFFHASSLTGQNCPVLIKNN